MPEVRSVHNIVITDEPEGRLVEFHVELDGEQTVKEGHDSASRLEEKVARLDPCIARVISHIEPVGCLACRGEASELERELIQDTVDQIAGLFPEVQRCRDIHVHSTDNGYRVFLCCQFDPQLSVNRAHEIATRLEGVIRSRHTEVDSVTIHLEPVW
jgi:divalent metal cation (Fe/Co/Zn/Cd) transporter